MCMPPEHLRKAIILHRNFDPRALALIDRRLVHDPRWSLIFFSWPLWLILFAQSSYCDPLSSSLPLSASTLDGLAISCHPLWSKPLIGEGPAFLVRFKATFLVLSPTFALKVSVMEDDLPFPASMTLANTQFNLELLSHPVSANSYLFHIGQFKCFLLPKGPRIFATRWNLSLLEGFLLRLCFLLKLCLLRYYFWEMQASSSTMILKTNYWLTCHNSLKRLT